MSSLDDKAYDKAYYVDPDPARAETLAPRAFLDPAFLEREFATIFRSSWLLVPERPASELRDDPRSLKEIVAVRGARAPLSLMDKPLFLQRDWDGALRAFPNVCTHAWHTLVQGPERERVILCPQHGRRFDCAGRYLSQPGFEDVPDFPREADHLQAFPVEEWGPFLFTCPGEPVASFDDVFIPLNESLVNFPLGRLRRAPQAGEVREIAGNWKQHAWNYMDRFHIPFLHARPGGLADAVDTTTYRTELHPHAALQWVYARNPEHGFDPALLPERFRHPGKRVFALWWFVFPNLALNFYPWGLSVNAYSPVPGKPARTLFLWYHYVLDEEKYAEREAIWLNRDVDLEDVDAIAQVSRGVRSGFARRGRFAPREEAGPHWFHRLVHERAFGPGSG